MDLVTLRNRRRRNFKGIAEHGGSHAFRVSMVAFAVRAAGHVQVDAEVAVTVFLEQVGADLAPLVLTPVELDFDRVQAVLHALDMRTETDHATAVGRHDFVNTVAKQEATIHRGNPGFLERHVFTV